MGTISAWLGHHRFGSESLKYVPKGGARPSGPPAKSRVHNVPWGPAVAAVTKAVCSLGTYPSALCLSLVFMGILVML